MNKLIATILLVGSLFATQPTINYTFTDGKPIRANGVNWNFDSLFSCWQGDASITCNMVSANEFLVEAESETLYKSYAGIQIKTAAGTTTYNATGNTLVMAAYATANCAIHLPEGSYISNIGISANVTSMNMYLYQNFSLVTSSIYNTSTATPNGFAVITPSITMEVAQPVWLNIKNGAAISTINGIIILYTPTKYLGKGNI